MICEICSIEKPTDPEKPDKLPFNWKRFGGQVMCQKCKKAGLTNLVITMPIVACDELSQNDLYTAFREASKEVRLASNIAMREYAKIDPGLKPDGKLDKFKPDTAAYTKVRDAAPGLDTSSLASLLKRLSGTYSARRFDMHISGVSSLPHFARLQPIPIKGSAWVPGFDSSNRPIVSLRLGSRLADGARCERITVRLAGGKEFGRQLADFKKIVAGTAIGADARICPRYIEGKLRGLLLRMTLTKPRKVVAEKSAVVVITTGGADSILTWDGMPPIHSCEFKNLIEGHAARNQRMADDLKHERRIPHDRRAGLVAKMGERANEYRNTIKTRLEQLTAKVMGWCERRNFGTIEWRVGDESQFPKFPWAELREKVKMKCGMNGVMFLLSLPIEASGAGE